MPRGAPTFTLSIRTTRASVCLIRVPPTYFTRTPAAMRRQRNEAGVVAREGHIRTAFRGRRRQRRGCGAGGRGRRIQGLPHPPRPLFRGRPVPDRRRDREGLPGGHEGAPLRARRE